MEIGFKYGDTAHHVRIPEEAEISILRPAPMTGLGSLDDALNRALDEPVGCGRFEDIVRRKMPHRVTIVIPDESRPVPARDVLPQLLQRLYSAAPGLTPSDVSIVIGGGLHAPAGFEEIRRIVPPDKARGCRVSAHDPFNARFVDVGSTARGTPVMINADVAEADFKIVVGQIDPHQFVGFTGGAKGIVIGCAAPESIERNHSMMLQKRARAGVIKGNPAREDMNEAGEMVGIDMAVNIVLDADNRPVRLLAGKPAMVLSDGARTCAALYGMVVEDPFDIVVASCGGYPKDSCLYQAQKGLNMASGAAKQGGKILLLAAAAQGVGDDAYFEYVSQFSTPEEVMEDFKKIGFKMGAHKAFLFARTLVSHDVAVFSDLDPDVLERCHLTAAEPESVLEKWVAEFDGVPRVAVVPNANTTYFMPPGELQDEG
jgi:nickel-dependent lactate racemase